MEKDNKIMLIIDGEEKEFNILFTYHHKDRDADYAFIYQAEDEENIFLVQYFDDNSLEIIEDEQILSEAQELLDAFDEGKLESEDNESNK